MQISLRSLLTLPFVLQIVGITSLVGYLSYRSGQQAVEEMSHQLMSQAAQRVEQRLTAYLGNAQRDLARSQLTLEAGQVDTDDLQSLQQYLFRVLQLDNSYIALGYGSATGKSLVVGWDEDLAATAASGYIAAKTEDPQTGNNIAHRLDDQGQPVEVLQTVSDYDPRQLIWYQTAAEQAQAAWTPIYPLVLKPFPAMLAVTPLRQNKQLEGVLFATVPMSRVSQFLSEIDFAPQGQIFIIEANGDLVATSTQEEVYTADTGTESQPFVRVNASESHNPLTQITTQGFLEQSETLPLREPWQWEFDAPEPTLEGSSRQHYFASATPFEDDYGLEWTIVTVVPRADFMGQIQQTVKQTALLCGVALIGTVGFSLWLTQRLLQPLKALNQATQEFAADAVPFDTQPTIIREVDSLQQTFQQMTHRLDESFRELKASEQRFATLLENVPVGVGVFNAQGQIVWSNSISKLLVGQDTLETDPTRLSETYQLYRAETDELYPIEHLPAMRALQGETVMADDIEIRYTTPPKTVLLEVHAAPVRDASGQITYAIVAFRDISERQAMERLKNQYAQDLEQEVARKTAALEEARHILEVQATTDSLTQIPNRYQLESFLELEWRLCRRNHTPLAILMVDVDHFKAYNDHYGHLQGDVCLHQVAQLLNRCVQRASDIVARYGGEEFVLVLPQIDARGAIRVAEHIQQTLLEKNIPHRGSSVSDRITVSIGIATIYPMADTSPEEALGLADAALYEAKAHRNCYRIRQASGQFT